jgi:hypothetical protein
VRLRSLGYRRLRGAHDSFPPLRTGATRSQAVLAVVLHDLLGAAATARPVGPCTKERHLHHASAARAAQRVTVAWPSTRPGGTSGVGVSNERHASRSLHSPPRARRRTRESVHGRRRRPASGLGCRRLNRRRASSPLVLVREARRSCMTDRRRIVLCGRAWHRAIHLRSAVLRSGR